MNKTMKMLLAGVAIIAVSTSVYARGCDCGFGDGPMMGGKSMERMEKMRERHLASLHDELKLTAQQESAWKKFAASNPMPGKMDRPDSDKMKKLNAPQRMEQGLERMRVMEKNMGAHLAVLKEFYATLTPEQQKTFDEQMSRRGHHGGFGR